MHISTLILEYSPSTVKCQLHHVTGYPILSQILKNKPLQYPAAYDHLWSFGNCYDSVATLSKNWSWELQHKLITTGVNNKLVSQKFWPLMYDNHELSGTKITKDFEWRNLIPILHTYLSAMYLARHQQMTCEAEVSLHLLTRTIETRLFFPWGFFYLAKCLIPASYNFKKGGECHRLPIMPLEYRSKYVYLDVRLS